MDLYIFSWKIVSEASLKTINKGTLELRFNEFLSNRWVLVCESRQYDETCFLFFLICLSMLSLSLPLLGLGFKSASLSAGFQVYLS